MKPGQSYLPLDSAFPYRGLDSVSPSTIMHPSFSPDMLDTIIVDGRVASRKGYESMGANVNGTVMLTKEFITADGTKWLMVITTTREYYYDGTTDTYIEISAGYGEVEDIRDGGGSDDEIDVEGDFTLVYTVGTKITVTGATTPANDGTYTVVSSSYSSPDTTVLVATGSITTAEAGVAATKARQDRTGTELNSVDFTQGSDSSGTYFFVTNGVDFPRFWDGSDTMVIFDDALITFSGSFVSCKTLEILNGYLVLGGLFTSSEEYRIVAWSDTLDFFEYTAGNSGTSLIPGAIGDVWKLTRLSDRIAIYTQGGSVHLMTHVGQAILFAFDTIFTGLALVGPRAYVNLGAFHVVLSSEGFFVFDGSRLLRPYGKDIISRFIKDNLSPDFAIRAFGFNDVPNSQAYFVIPISETKSLTLLVEYNLGDFRQSIWTVLDYTNRPTAFGYYSRHDDLTWTSLQTANPTLTWEDLAFDYLWNSRGIQQGFPVRVFGSGSAVYRAEDTLPDDDGVAFTSRWQTIEYTVPGAFRSTTGRWLEIEGEFFGDSIDIKYSVDSGVTWIFAKTSTDGSDADGVTLTTAWQKLKFFIDVVSDTIIVRVSCPDAQKGFSHRDLRVWVIEGGRN